MYAQLNWNAGEEKEEGEEEKRKRRERRRSWNDSVL